jgi:hypothetical protein
MAKTTAYHSNTYLERALTDEEKLHLHNWSLDYQIQENERLFPTVEDADYPREAVDTKQVLSAAGLELVPPPPNPSPAGQPVLQYTGPLVVEGENDKPPEPGELATRVPLPRDHPLTGVIAEDQGLTHDSVIDATGIGDSKNQFPAVVGEGEPVAWDEEAVWTEVCRLTVDELKDNLKDMEQPVSGNKDELRERLFNALRDAHEAEAAGTAE